MHRAQVDPAAGSNVADQQGGRKKQNQHKSVFTFLISCFGHSDVKKSLKGKEHLVDVSKAQKLEQIHGLVLLQSQHWRNRREYIEYKVALQIAAAYVSKGFIFWLGRKEI